jgi:putative transposase
MSYTPIRNLPGIGPPKRQEFLQNSSSVFAQGKKKEQESVDTGKLYEEIGRLKVEVDRPATWFLKKKSLAKPVEEKRAMIETDHPVLSIKRQCELVGLCRSVFYRGGDPLSASQNR